MVFHVEPGAPGGIGSKQDSYLSGSSSTGCAVVLGWLQPPSPHTVAENLLYYCTIMVLTYAHNVYYVK